MASCTIYCFSHSLLCSKRRVSSCDLGLPSVGTKSLCILGFLPFLTQTCPLTFASFLQRLSIFPLTCQAVHGMISLSRKLFSDRLPASPPGRCFVLALSSNDTRRHRNRSLTGRSIYIGQADPQSGCQRPSNDAVPRSVALLWRREERKLRIHPG